MSYPINGALVASNGYNFRGHQFPKGVQTLLVMENEESIHYQCVTSGTLIDRGVMDPATLWEVHEIPGNLLFKLRKKILNGKIRVSDETRNFFSNVTRWNGKLYYYFEEDFPYSE